MSDTESSDNTPTPKPAKPVVPHLPHADAIAVLDNVRAAHPDLLEVEEKTGWTKVTGRESGLKVYIQLREEVREIHLSGFGAGLPGTKEPPKKNGKVLAWIDMEGDDPASALEAALTTVATSKKEVKPAKPKPEVKAATAPKSDPAKKAEKRIEDLKKRAEALGLGSAVEPPPAVEEPAQADPAAAG